MIFFIDGNNVGSWIPSESNKVSFATVLSLCNQLKKMGHKFVCYFDATGRHKVLRSEKVLFEGLLKRSDYFRSSPPRERADLYLLDDATDEFDAGETVSVISNDLYRDFLDPNHPEYKPAYDRFKWLAQNEKLHFKGSAIRHKSGEIKLKILSLNINITVDTDVVKLISEILNESNNTSINNKSTNLTNNEIILEEEKQGPKAKNKLKETNFKSVNNMSNDIAKADPVLLVVNLDYQIEYFKNYLFGSEINDVKKDYINLSTLINSTSKVWLEELLEEFKTKEILEIEVCGFKISPQIFLGKDILGINKPSLTQLIEKYGDIHIRKAIATFLMAKALRNKIENIFKENGEGAIILNAYNKLAIASGEINIHQHVLMKIKGKDKNILTRKIFSDYETLDIEKVSKKLEQSKKDYEKFQSIISKNKITDLRLFK